MTRTAVVCLFAAVFVITDGLSSDWEDPSDIFGTSKYSLCGTEVASLKENLAHCQDELDELRETKGCKGPRIVKERSVADNYIQRLINVLLASADFKNRKLGKGHEMRVSLDLYFNSETLPVLQAYGSGDTNGHSWSELDTAFIKVFSGDPTFNAIFSEALGNDDVGESFAFLDSQYQSSFLTILIAIIGGFAVCVIWVFLMGGTRSVKPAIFIGSVLLFSSCFGWTFWSETQHLRMEHMIEVRKSAGGELPEYCLNPSSGWFGWFLKANREQECIKFLKSQNINHMANVDLHVVFRKTLQVVFSWIPALAHSVSEAVRMFYGDSWLGGITGFFAKVVMAPMVTLVGLLVLFLYLVTRSSFRLRTLVGEISYGHAQDCQEVPQGRAQDRQEISYRPRQERISHDNQLAIGGSLDSPVTKSNAQAERRKFKDRGWFFKSRLKHKLNRSETSPGLNAQHRPGFVDNANERLPTRPFEPVPLALKKMTKKRAEEKAFRELRRAYSTIESPLATNLEMT